jgi:thiamine transporter
MTGAQPTQQVKGSPQGTVRILAESAVMVALATVLNSVKVITLPEGGSVTLGAMIPLLYLSLRRGVKVGMAAGAVFGIIDVYFEPFIYNFPFQFLLDYPLAFGALGLAGFFSGRAGGGSASHGSARAGAWAVLGTAVGIGGRFVCHFLSGVIFFATYAPPEMSPVLYSALYNASYLLPELAISAFVIFVLADRGLIRVGL